MDTRLDKLNALYADILSQYERFDTELARDDAGLFRIEESVSAWSVANQLHHTAVATALMLAAVDRIAKQTKPATPDGRINAVGRAVLISRRFPRGEADAPERTKPPETVTRETLEAAVARSRRRYDRMPDILEKAAVSDWRVEHAYFGGLDAAQWLKLATVHANHHFLIIDDIDQAGQS